MNVGIWSLFMTFSCVETVPHMSHIYCELDSMQVPHLSCLCICRNDVGLLPSFYSFVQLYVDNKSCMQALTLQGNINCVFLS